MTRQRKYTTLVPKQRQLPLPFPTANGNGQQHDVSIQRKHLTFLFSCNTETLIDWRGLRG